MKLLEVKPKAECRWDLAAAYEPEVGVKKFIRKFEFTAPDKFVVTDDVETNAPQIITAFLHADNAIEKVSDNSFFFEPNGAPKLLVEIIEPSPAETKSEKNILTAPGRPGSVDKGTREERGVRLAISTAKKVTDAKFITRLKIVK